MKRAVKPTRTQVLRLQARNQKIKEDTRDATLLPDEILLKVFTFLDVKDVLSCASICHRWSQVANDNSLWKSFYYRHITLKLKKKSETEILEPPSPLQACDKYWKSIFIRKCISLRDKRFQKLDKCNSFTGTTDCMREKLDKLGMKFLLCLEEKDKKCVVSLERRRKVFDSSTLITWYSLKNWPRYDSLCRIKVFSSTPLLHGDDKKLSANVPRQRKLILDVDIRKIIKEKHPAYVQDAENVDVYRFGPFLIALWKGSHEIAFVFAGIHHHNLLKKCLFSSSEQMFDVKHKVKPDDIDKKYGYHGYKCHFLLHSTEYPILSQLFLCDKNSDSNDGGVRFQLEKNFCDNFENEKSLQWKTDVFKGVIENLIFISITLRDINSDVIWKFTSPIRLLSSSHAGDFDFDSPSSSLHGFCEDETGKVEFDLKKQEMFGDYSMENAFIEIKYNILCAWFGTKMNLR